MDSNMGDSQTQSARETPALSIFPRITLGSPHNLTHHCTPPATVSEALVTRNSSVSSKPGYLVRRLLVTRLLRGL